MLERVFLGGMTLTGGAMGKRVASLGMVRSLGAGCRGC